MKALLSNVAVLYGIIILLLTVLNFVANKRDHVNRTLSPGYNSILALWYIVAILVIAAAVYSTCLQGDIGSAVGVIVLLVLLAYVSRLRDDAYSLLSKSYYKKLKTIWHLVHFATLLIPVINIFLIYIEYWHFIISGAILGWVALTFVMGYFQKGYLLYFGDGKESISEELVSFINGGNKDGYEQTALVLRVWMSGGAILLFGIGLFEMFVI